MRARTHTCAHTTVTAVWDINQGYIRVVLMQADLTSHNTHTHAHTHTLAHAHINTHTHIHTNTHTHTHIHLSPEIATISLLPSS